MLDVKAGAGVQAFGNSIPYGNLAASGYGYVNRIASYIGGAVDNRAIGGSGMNSITQQGYSYHAYSSRTKLVTWDGPLNDIRRSGADALPAIIPSLNAFLLSAFAGMCRPASYPHVVKTGSWSAFGATYGGKAFRFSATPLYTIDPAATMSLTFTAGEIGVHAFITDASCQYKDLLVDIDGEEQVLPFSGLARPGDVASGGAYVLRGLDPVQPHTITVKPVEAGQYTVVDCFTVPIIAGMAPVLVGHVPYLEIWGQYGSIATQELVDAANCIIDEVVEEWKCSGFPVEVVPVNDFYHAATDCDVDGIHPDTLGHANYGLAYLSRLHVIA